MSKSEIGGLKALASDGSEGSSRERALAHSLASSIYVYIYIYIVERQYGKSPHVGCTPIKESPL